MKNSKNDKVVNYSVTELNTWLRKLTYFIFTWETLGLIFIITKSVIDKKLNFWNLNYGDFYRTDLGYLVGVGSFANPYEYHPELPQITVTNYLPLPFLLFKLFNIRLIDSWSKYSIQVQAFTYLSMFLLFLIIYLSMRNYRKSFRILSGVTFGILSVPSMYIFSTANTQAVVTFFVFIGFLPLLGKVNHRKRREKKDSSDRFLRLSSFVLVGSFKPQYLSFNFLQYASRVKLNIIELGVAMLATTFLVILGFSSFSGGLQNNFEFFLKSLSQFTSSNIAFVVHNNVSLIGNLSAFEVFINKNSINNSIIINNNTLILGIYIFLSLILFLKLYLKKAPIWLNTWILGGLAITATPVSFAYSFTAILISLGLFFNSIQRKDSITVLLFNTIRNRILFGIALFSVFPPKFLHVTLVERVADTNLYAMFTSVSHICILILGFGVLRLKEDR